MTQTVQWVANDGTTITLNTEWGTTGTFAPPSKVDEEGLPGQSGGQLYEVRHGIRQFSLPIWLYDGSDTAQYLTMRQLCELMDPTKGVGRVRLTSPVGDQREITCIATDGLDVNTGDATPNVQKTTVVFRAHDPYWYGSEIVDEFTAGARPNFFPFFPLRLSSSEVFADVTVTNTGTVDAWPVVEVEGAGSSIALRNLTTGLSLGLSSSILEGESITVDTRPGHKTVTKSDGSNLFPDISLTDAALWPLVPGANALRLEMGGTSDLSLIRFRYSPRYLTA